MTEQSPGPQRSNPNPRKSIFYGLLVLAILLVAVIIVYTRLYQQGLIPALLWPATPTQTGTPLAEIISSDAHSSGYLSLVKTLTAGPPTETPSMEKSSSETPTSETLLDEAPIASETPVLTTPFSPSLTPAFGSCQYTLKPGPGDFLYALYWNWHINANIPVVEDFYVKIHCAPLLSNFQCAYRVDDPDSIQPGWILILPGVSSNICLYHGGTPALP
jgi:hypothetical protein